MVRRRRYKPIVRVRRALLVGLILAGGAVAGYYFSDRFGIEGGGRQTSGQDEPLEVTEGLLTVAHGFDYEVSDGSELAFRVRAEKLVSDVEDRMVLDEVEIELPQESGEVVVVKGKKGTIHLDSKSALLEGRVQARTEDGIELRGQGFEVIREGRTLVSTAPVTSLGRYVVQPLSPES